MKSIKTFFGIFAALAAIAASNSCTLEQQQAASFQISATIDAAATRLGFEAGDASLTPSWKVGDELFGYDDKGAKFTFTVTSVAGQEAVVDAGGYTPGNAQFIYATCYPGKSVADIANESLPVDLSSQNGLLGDGFPMILTATGRIRDGKVALSFRAATAVVGIRQIKVGAGEKIAKVVVTGVRATGVVSSDHGMMDLIPDDAVSSVTVATDLTADANGFISTPLYISVMPTPGAAIGLKAYSDKGEEYATLSMISSADIEAANYYYLSKKMGIAVAEIVETGELFASIHSAIERSNASLTPVTVKLRSDITVKDSIIVKNENCLTTIDFNGYTITGNLMGAPVLRVKSDLTLNDSSAGGNGGIVNTYANVNSRAIYVLWNSQLLTINGGTYSSKADTGVIYYRGISSKIVINGGKFINNRATGGSAVYIYGSTSISGVINGGTFICNNGGSGNAVRSANKAKVTINGGYFHNGTSSGQSVGQASTAGITGNVYGGYFNKALPAEYIATGHTGKAVSVEHDGLTYSYMVE